MILDKFETNSKSMGAFEEIYNWQEITNSTNSSEHLREMRPLFPEEYPVSSELSFMAGVL